jgi:hypothetical protein
MMEYHGENCEPVEPESLRAHQAGGGRVLVLVVHDEAICQSKDGCISSYMEKGNRKAAAKSMGPSLMISGVLSEKVGRIEFTKEEWEKFEAEKPEKAAALKAANVKWHKKDDTFFADLLENGIRSPNIVIFPGKVRFSGGEGGREGRRFESEEVFVKKKNQLNSTFVGN